MLFQEWALGPLVVKEEPLDVVQGEIPKEHAEIFKDTKQNIDLEVALPGTGIACPTLLLPLEGQNVAEAELTKIPGVQVDQVMNTSKTGGTLHMVEQTLMHSNQQTMFWHVLQEDGENVDSLERFFTPHLDTVPHPVKRRCSFWIPWKVRESQARSLVPLQEWAVDSLEAKEEAACIVHGEVSKEHAEIFGDAQQNVNGEVSLPGIGIANPTLLLPIEGQDMAEAELTKALGVQVDQVMNPSKTGGTLHMVQQTPMQSNQQTTFWHVLQEDAEHVDSVVKKEETFLPDTVQNLRFPGQETDDGKGDRLKNFLAGGNGPEEMPKTIIRENQGNVQMAAETQEEERSESTSRQAVEPHTECKKYCELAGGLGTACSIPRPLDTEEEKASFSTYGRKYLSKPGCVLEHAGEEYNEGPPLGDRIQSNSDLDKHQRSQMEVKNDCLEYGA
ncbi:hypothetical protein lerEdw1_011193, partial [Lerista edwardsae]